MSHHRSSDDIRRDIERKRAQLDDTVDALERKLSPGQMLDHALWFLRGSESGSEKARAAGRTVVDFAKEHPIPVALMGASAAWFAAEQRGHDDVGPGTYARAEGRVGPYRGDAVHGDGFGADGDGLKARAADTAHEVGDRIGDAKDTATDRLSTMKDRAGEKLESAKDRASEKLETAKNRTAETFDSARESARETMNAAGARVSSAASSTRDAAVRGGRQARELYDSTLEENPLAIGAAAFGLGIAAGLSAPTTRWEDRHLGPASDTLKDEARGAAQDAARAAKAATRTAANEVRRQVSSEGLVDELKDKAKRVASEAAQAARETARDEGMSADALRERARTAGERTRSAARDGLR